MKITVTGSLGNISRPLVEKLIAAGHEVKVISSNADRADEIRSLGAVPAIGSVEDDAFLENAFSGADAVYTMVPPNSAAPDLRKFMSSTGEKYAAAIKKAGIKKVVNLSSIGAHLPDGTGPIKGLYDVEHTLNKPEGVSVTHLRAGFFYVNFFGNINMIRHMNILGSNYAADQTLIMVHPKDIAVAVAEELQKESSGITVKYITSDEKTTGEVASVLGAAIGKPELPWIEFSDEQALQGILQAGVPEETAKNLVEMGTAVRSGILWEDYRATGANAAGAVKTEDFAKEFAEIFKKSA